MSATEEVPMEEGGGGKERSQLVAGSNSQQAGENAQDITIKVPNSKTGGGEEGATLLSNEQRADGAVRYGQIPQDGAVRYGQIPQDGAVVVTVPAAPMTDPPSSYFIPAILSMVCCWFPIGRRALKHAQSCKDAISAGDRAGATEHSTQAKKLTIRSIIVGLVINLILITIFILLMYFGVVPSPGNIFGKNQKLIWLDL